MEQISSTITEMKPGGYKVTFKKIARAAAAEWRVHKKSAVITLVLYGVAMVLFIFNSIEVPHNPYYRPEFVLSGWGAFFAVIGMIMSFPAALNVFRDTNNQQLCDVAMALPIKAVERFFSKLLCLLYIQVIPFTVSVLGGSGIAILCGTIKYGKLDGEPVKTLFALFLGGLAAVMFVMSITVLCACCCGAPAESSYFSIMLMVIVNVLPMTFVNNILIRSAGFSQYWQFDTSEGIDMGWWGFLYIFGDFDYIILHAAVGCVISLAVMTLAVLIYKRRDARSVGTPISSRVFFEIIMAAGCVTILALGVMSEWMLWTVLIAGVAYLIINIVVSRAKINLWAVLKWVGKFAVTLAAFAGLLVACVKTGGFGYYKLRPETQYLEGAEFSVVFGGYYSQYADYYYDPWTKVSTEALTAEQADEIMRVIQRHEAKGLAQLNPIDRILDRSDNWIIVSVDSDVRYSKRPRPHSQFREGYYSYEDGSYTEGYYLSYYQYLYLSSSEKDELFRELSRLDCVSVYTPSGGESYPDTAYAVAVN